MKHLALLHARTGSAPARRSRIAPGLAPGQTLVLFALFLTVLLGVSALGIDYATWLLTDRKLQNLADSAAAAGASTFGDRIARGSCSVTPGDVKCAGARLQAWTSLNHALNLGMDDAALASVAAQDRMALTSWTSGTTTTDFDGRTIWVTTPPPNDPVYTAVGGRYALNFGVVWVRVDQLAPSFFAHIFGIGPQARKGWATAGALPTGFALQTFCRNNIAPQSGVCENSAGVTIDGQGGIRLLTGDIASNESLKVTAQGGQGVVLDAGDMFVVTGECGSSTWNCPNSPPLGGISDGVNGKNAFYTAPLPVPRYESPVEYATLTTCPTTAQWNADGIPCIPMRNQYGTDPAPNQGAWVGTWTCGDGTTECGTPVVTTVSGLSTVTCDPGPYDPSTRFMRPNNVDLNQANKWDGSQFTGNAMYQNINEPTMDPPGTLPATTPGSEIVTGPPANYVFIDDDLANRTLRVGLTPPQGLPSGASLTVRYVVFRTANGVVDTSPATPVPTTVRLVEKTGNNSYTLRGTVQSQDATEVMTVYQYDVSLSTINNFNKLYLEFNVTTAVPGRGAGFSWAEAEIPNLLPPAPPTVKPGYWRSITIPDNSCALLDPSPSFGLQQYQMPGVFRFGGSGDPGIIIGSNAFLIGDAVTLAFDADWPDPAGNKGLSIGANGALVLNTARSGGVNPSFPLENLPYDAVNAAWQVDPSFTVGTYPGSNTWPICLVGGNECVPRSCYMNTDPGVCDGQTIPPVTDGRGVTFYFTPTGWPPTTIQRRFQLGGGTSTEPGIAFRGVLYAPYDDVKISGSNGFTTVGQVLSWTAKFNGGSAYIYLEYPYSFAEADPYLLEPRVR